MQRGATFVFLSLLVNHRTDTAPLSLNHLLTCVHSAVDKEDPPGTASDA